MQLGQLLVERRAVGIAELESVIAEQQRSVRHERLGTLLVRHGLISEATLYAALSEQLGLPLWSQATRHDVIEAAAAARDSGQALPEALARRWDAFVAFSSETGRITIVSRDPLATELVEHVRMRWGEREADWMLATAQELQSALQSIYQAQAGEPLLSQAARDLRQLAEDAPVVELVASMLARGTDLSASDIHLEPNEAGFVVRYRVDGALRQSESYPRSRFDAVVSRIKLVSALDIAERRLPQDGRFSTRAAGIETEVRVSVIPGVHGESVVMRLLPKTATRRFRLDALGLEPDHLTELQQWLALPDGIVLVTGPTGSGKSTTLYAALAASDTERTRVLTVEDPVEYKLPGITQFQVQSDIGFSFAAALRAILRHDPDTIMVGEIRDAETARIAIQAALTGHMVLSTLHTNDAASAFVRLVDMGIEPFLLAASVRGVIAQRLIRRLCLQCAKPQDPAQLPERLRAAAEATGLAWRDFNAKVPTGCPACEGTGYRGRTAVHEFLPATASLRHHLVDGSLSPSAVREQVGSGGYRSLQEDALRRYWRGETSLAEVLTLPDASSARTSP